jgi:hypothetical protein
LPISKRLDRMDVTRYKWIRPVPRHVYSMVVA